MVDVNQIFAVAQSIDESPECLSDPEFRTTLDKTVEVVNGQFLARASSRGIDHQAAERWLAATEELARQAESLSIEGAADLAVRLSAVSYILSDQRHDPELDPGDLLATASLPEGAN